MQSNLISADMNTTAPTSIQVLQPVKTALIVSVLVTIAVLMIVGWKGAGLQMPVMRPTARQTQSAAVNQSSRSTSPHDTSTHRHSNSSSALNQISSPRRLQVEPCRNPDIQVLGKKLDTCAASEAVRLAEEEDIYFSIKTTARNHVSRMLPVLLTWLQAVNPKQVHIVTDTISKSDVLYKVASKTDIDIVTTDCAKVHSHAALCCKSRNEYFRYFNTTKASGELYRWYCHFDDDEYVNIPALVAAIREAMNNSEDGGVYFGRWPKENVPLLPYGMPVSRETLKVLGFELEKQLTVKWATGAAYCVSSIVMKKVKEILDKHMYEVYCARFGLSDDTTAAIFIGMSGYFLTDNKRVKTQYDRLAHLPRPDLTNLISIGHRTLFVKLPNKTFSRDEDKTGLMAYHCLLYPSTSWCKN